MRKQIRDLYDEILEVIAQAEGEPDSRFRHWVKQVENVDTEVANGYAFEGKFINEGTIEIAVEPAVFLVKTVRGSRKYQTATYNVVIMDGDGKLSLADIRTTDAKPGWALRIRDKVAELVQNMRE